MTDLLIRDLDPDAHRELKRRAELAGQSLQAYVAGLLESHAGRPDRAEWFRRLHELAPVPGVSGSEAVSAARDEMP